MKSAQYWVLAILIGLVILLAGYGWMKSGETYRSDQGAITIGTHINNMEGIFVKEN